MVGLLGKGGMQELAPGRLQLQQPSAVNGVKLFDPSDFHLVLQTDPAKVTIKEPGSSSDQGLLQLGIK